MRIGHDYSDGDSVDEDEDNYEDDNDNDEYDCGGVMERPEQRFITE